MACSAVPTNQRDPLVDNSNPTPTGPQVKLNPCWSGAALACGAALAPWFPVFLCWGVINRWLSNRTPPCSLFYQGDPQTSNRAAPVFPYSQASEHNPMGHCALDLCVGSKMGLGGASWSPGLENLRLSKPHLCRRENLPPASGPSGSLV